MRDRPDSPHFFCNFFLNAGEHVYEATPTRSYPWTIQRRNNRNATQDLCRRLCRNPSIHARVGCARVMLLGYRCRAGNSEQTRMNTASSSRSRSFGVARCFLRQRTVTTEAAGSSPVVPAILSKRLSWLLGNRRNTQENTH